MACGLSNECVSPGSAQAARQCVLDAAQRRCHRVCAPGGTGRRLCMWHIPAQSGRRGPQGSSPMLCSHDRTLVRAHAHTYTCTHMRINAITRVRNFVTSCSPLVACAGQAEEQTRLGRLWVLEVVQVLPRPRPRGPFLLTFVLGAFMLAPVLAPLPPTPYTRSHLSPYGTLACGTRCRSKTMEGIQRVLGASALTNPPILGCEVCPRDCPLRTSAACRCWLLTVPYAFVCGSRDVCMRVRVWMCWPGPLIDCPGSEVLTRSLN